MNMLINTLMSGDGEEDADYRPGHLVATGATMGNEFK